MLVARLVKSVLRQLGVCPSVNGDLTRSGGVRADRVVREGQAGGGWVRSGLLVVQNTGQQNGLSFLLLSVSLLSVCVSCVRRRRQCRCAAGVVSVGGRRRSKRGALAREGECVNRSGPRSLLSIWTLRVLPAAPLFQILHVVRHVH